MAIEVVASDVTRSPVVELLLDELLARLRTTLPGNLVGVYLYGSLATGGFTEGASDIDLVAATVRELDDDDLERLRAMHAGIVDAHPEWADRIEVAYVTTSLLRNYLRLSAPIGIVSPGEPLHRVVAGRDWLVNWHVVRAHGITLYGPPAPSLIVPVPEAEFVAHVRDQLAWRTAPDAVAATRGHAGSQAYLVLTLCRALHVLATGRQVSKQDAAAWLAERNDTWRGLVDWALATRLARGEVDGASASTSFPEVERFAAWAVDEAAALPSA